MSRAAEPGTVVSAPRNAWGTASALLGAAALLVLYVGYSSRQSYHLDVTLLFVVYAVIALGMYVPVFLGGYIDLAYNAYFAIGAYAVAIWSARTDQSVLWSVPLGCLVAAAAALVVGVVTSRLTGFHLALATLVMGTAMYRLLVTSPDVTGGAAGLGGIDRPSLLGSTMEREHVVITGLVLTWLLAVWLGQFRCGPVGLALRLKREAPAAADACGVPSRTLQASSLMAGACIASLAGALFAFMNQFVLAESFTISIVFIVLFLPLVGGLGSPWGAVLGAGIVTATTQGASLFDGPGALLFGLVTLAVLVLFPSGLLGLLRSALVSVAKPVRSSRG